MVWLMFGVVLYECSHIKLSASDGIRKRTLTDLSNTIHNSVFALKLLPPDACPSLVCIFKWCSVDSMCWNS